MADQTKENAAIVVDGLRFVRVRFESCQLSDEARDETAFEDCVYEGVSWTFDGAADRMITVLAMLNATGGAAAIARRRRR